MLPYPLGHLVVFIGHEHSERRPLPAVSRQERVGLEDIAPVQGHPAAERLIRRQPLLCLPGQGQVVEALGIGHRGLGESAIAVHGEIDAAELIQDGCLQPPGRRE